MKAVGENAKREGEAGESYAMRGTSSAREGLTGLCVVRPTMLAEGNPQAGSAALVLVNCWNIKIVAMVVYAFQLIVLIIRPLTRTHDISCAISYPPPRRASPDILNALLETHCGISNI